MQLPPCELYPSNAGAGAPITGGVAGWMASAPEI